MEGLPADSLEARRRAELRLITGLCDLFFSSGYYSLESSGLGFMSLKINDAEITRLSGRAGLSVEIFKQVCNSAIRLLGICIGMKVRNISARQKGTGLYNDFGLRFKNILGLWIK